MDVGVSCVSSTSKFITNAQAVERDIAVGCIGASYFCA